MTYDSLHALRRVPCPLLLLRDKALIWCRYLADSSVLSPADRVLISSRV